MKCKFCDNNMFFLTGDEFLEIHQCEKCQSLVVSNIEIIDGIDWYNPEKYNKITVYCV